MKALLHLTCIQKSIGCAAVALLLTGCALNRPSPALEEARSTHLAMQRDARVGALAPAEFMAADEAWHRAETIWLEHSSQARITEAAQAARQKAALAMETARRREAEQQLAVANAERQRLAVEQEQQRLARVQAEAARRAELDRLAEAQRQEEAARQAAQAAAARASAIDEEARTREEIRAAMVAAQLDPLRVYSTERGTILAVEDESFFAGRTQLSADAVRTLHRLADLLKRYPKSRIAIEGFANGMGDGESQSLSDQRAQSVRETLLDAGLGMGRVSARGYGKGSAAGSVQSTESRRRFFRIEIIISPA